MNLISHFSFRLSPAYLEVFAGVLDHTMESSEDTRMVRGVTEIFLHEEYEHYTYNNDIAIINVGLLFKYETLIFYTLVNKKHMCNEVQSEI